MQNTDFNTNNMECENLKRKHSDDDNSLAQPLIKKPCFKHSQHELIFNILSEIQANPLQLENEEYVNKLKNSLLPI